MDVTNRGADLGIAVGVDILLEEIHEPSIPLQDREDPQIWTGRLPGEEGLDPRRKVRHGEDSPEGLES